MDFFAAQDRAKARTRWLVVYFILGVAALVISLNVVVMVIWNVALSQGPASRQPAAQIGGNQFQPLWRGDVFAGVSLVTLAIVGGACLTKIAGLREGGSAVALSLGAAPVARNTVNPAERRLLNIVEEMALASGVPVPPVYVIEEPGINAFAAGFRPEDAVVTVTRGSLERLTRDELQGVVGHEFSHILNGDMRLNVQLIGAVFGLLVLTVIGREIMWAVGRGRVSGKDNRGRMALFLLGVALVVLGWLGVLFGRLIQAAVCRQREFLADASGVQFTRNPEGLAGALKKIGGLGAGSLIANAHAEETAHLFFAPALNSFFTTHPPLEMRIRALEPQWDGKFVTSTRVEMGSESPRPAVPPKLKPVPAENLLVPASVVAAMALEQMSAWRENLPGEISDALRDAAGCRALALALALEQDAVRRAEQIQHLQQQQEPAAAQAANLAEAAGTVQDGRRLPLLELALATLSELPKPERESLMTRLHELVHLDHEETLYEFALLRVAECRLNPRPPAKGPQNAEAYAEDVAMLLSTLAYLSAADGDTAREALLLGLSALPGLAGKVQLIARERATLDGVAAACTRLEGAPFWFKKQLLTAAAQVAQHDNVIEPAEAEMVRALAASLGCPLPPG